mmetsp:Transcript_44270/g.111260  ORF Transcript_44270/g.111260 Transcript_44270/m.111260 type:complete len:280 (+) Transcript_44270:211-1050(+)
MDGATSQSKFNFRPSTPRAKSARSSSRRISPTAMVSLPCRLSPTAFTRQPRVRAFSRSCSSTVASRSSRLKLSLLWAIASCFSSLVLVVSSRIAVTSTRNKDLSCGFVSSKSFCKTKSQASTSARNLVTSSGVTLGWLSNFKTLLCRTPLFAACTMSLVTSLSMPKKVGTQLVSVEISSSPSLPLSAIFCLMNMFAQRDTIRTIVFCICSWLIPRIPPTWGLAACHLSRDPLSWQVTAFHAKIPYISSLVLSSIHLPTVTGYASSCSTFLPSRSTLFLM